MRILNIIAAFAVLACNLVVSFNHSLDLFRSGGFDGYLAYVAVVGCEITFVMGALNIVLARIKNERPGIPAILGGLLGVLLVGWSNVAAGWAYGITGILLGLSTPVSLVIAESILGWAFIRNKKGRTDQQSGEIKEEPGQESLEPSKGLGETAQTAQEKPKTPVEWALYLYEKHNKPPSRRQLAQIANCTEWKARKVLEELGLKTRSA